MKRYIKYLLWAIVAIVIVAGATVVWRSARVQYYKAEYKIAMRDGVVLHTTVYAPRWGKDAPILLLRTPYSVAPYGEERMNGLEIGYLRHYTKAGYILAFQDVRGRFMSEGEYENVRPATGPISEESDTYDTVEWLVNNIERNNGRVGLVGCSYPGFYAMCGALSGHPAVKAVSPQAPVTVWFMGDDVHHNGVLMLSDAFRFMPMMSHQDHTPTTEWRSVRKHSMEPDQYAFFLNATRDSLRSIMHPSHFWDQMAEHPDYDEWWQERDLRRRCYDIGAAVLVVGGLFDAEDCFGAWNLYRSIRQQSPDTDCRLVVGPWAHGAWKEEEGNRLGDFDFGDKAAMPYYVTHFERPFFDHYLWGKNSLDEQPRVAVFDSGRCEWREFEEWGESKKMRLYLHNGGALSLEQPAADGGASSYRSDPSSPEPYHNQTNKRTRDYMIADQRFTLGRNDVLVFESEPLAEDLTLAGGVDVTLTVSLSTTDADFAVRLIDHYPSEGEKADYQMLVRGDIMRGRYRNSFSTPEPFEPHTPTQVHFTLPDISHTFRKGHRIHLCVQSSWYPLAERSPQQFVDLWSCKASDFVPCDVTLHHAEGRESFIEVGHLQ